MTDPYIVVLVGCGKAKHEGSLPAKDKYSSNYFSCKRNYAEEIGNEWHIVSAEHDLLSPGTVIDDYNTTIRGMSAEERTDWGGIVGLSIEIEMDILRSQQDGPLELHVLLGQDYIDPIVPHLEYVDRLENTSVHYPFDDTGGMGEQMAKLKDAVQEAQ